MAEKKPAGGTNKSEEIRKLARTMKEKGEKPRPVMIVAALKKQGIAVAPAQVSIVLKKMGFKPRKRRKARAVKAGAPARKAAGSHAAVSVDDLIAQEDRRPARRHRSGARRDHGAQAFRELIRPAFRRRMARVRRRKRIAGALETCPPRPDFACRRPLPA